MVAADDMGGKKSMENMNFKLFFVSTTCENNLLFPNQTQNYVTSISHISLYLLLEQIHQFIKRWNNTLSRFKMDEMM